MNTKAVIFDMDGVMVDNNVFHKKAWLDFCDQHHFKLTDSELEQYVYGRTNTAILNYLYKNSLNLQEISDFEEEKESLYRKLYLPHFQEVAGLTAFLKKLKNANFKLAIATSAYRKNIDYVLDKLPIRDLFDVIVDSSFVTEGKPNPQIYLKTAELLGINPKNCLVVEDSLSGVESGLRAGMRVLGVSTTHTAEELSNTSLVIPNFENVGVEEVNGILEM